MATAPREGWSKKHNAIARKAGKKSWAAWIAEIEAARGFAICGRIGRQKQMPCAQREAAGVESKNEGACRKHGGTSPAGEGASRYQHGERSRAPSVVHRTLRERMEGQPDTIRMMNAAGSLLMARLTDLVERIDLKAMGPGALAGARTLMREIGQARDVQVVTTLLGQLRGIVESESAVDDTWRDEMYRVIDLVGQHSDKMRKLLIDAREMIPRERALLMIDRFATAAVDVISGLPLTDEQKRQARRDLAATVQLTMNGRALPMVPATGTDDG